MNRSEKHRIGVHRNPVGCVEKKLTGHSLSDITKIDIKIDITNSSHKRAACLRALIALSLKLLWYS